MSQISAEQAFDVSTADDQRVKSLLARLARCTNLPSPPSIAIRIIDLAQDPEADLDDVVKVVSVDPALSSKILRIANSPLHGLRSPANTLRQATALLGLDSTLTLALGFAMVGGVKRQENRPFDYPRFWKSSLASACCARLIGTHLRIRKLEQLFLAGLLQDIGIVAIHAVEPDLYAGLDLEASHAALLRHEQTQLGTDHAEIGARMLKAWHLPDWLCAAVGASHSPGPGDPAGDRSHAIVALGARLADAGWVAQNSAPSEALTASAIELLGIDAAQWTQICEQATGTVRDTARLFDMDLSDWDCIDMLPDQAREVLVMRNLRTQAELAQFKSNTEGLRQKTEQLERANRCDGLTGLYNRAHLDEVLKVEFDKASRQASKLSVLFIDIDHFKRINDCHGHAAGDQILRESANVLRSATRRGDIVARYGGEEFVCVLPLTGGVGAQELGERLLEAFRQHRFQIGPGLEVQLTVSIGQASLQDPGRYADVAGLLKAADQALYEAKNQGRNQSRMAS